MAKDKKKLEHIQVKDNGIKLSNKVGDVLNDAKQILQKNLFEGLLKSSNETNITRYKIAQNNAFRDYSINTRKTIEKAKTEVKTALKQDSSVNLKNNQVNRMSADVNKGLLFLQQDAIKTYQSTLKDVLLHVKAASDLKEQLAKHIESGLNLGVVYKDGKNYQFDSYFEMKARTDIQQDIGKNMIDAGREAGVIFYITSFYGDCAPDHANYQGRIYYDENWESMAPKDRLEEVRKYIAKLDDEAKSLELPDGSVRTVMENKPFLTTRPNCRHYFQYIDIDSVLGAKTPDDVKNLRQERDLNFNGKYKPDKYQALQQQRLNERKIREYKADLVKAEQVLKLEPNDKVFQVKKERANNNIKLLQAAQRKLENEVLKNKKGEIIKDKQGKPIKKYDNIQRNYSREALRQRTDFEGGKTKIKVNFTDADNDRLIGRKKLGISKKSFDYINAQSQELLKKVKKDVRIKAERKLDSRLYYEDYLVRNYYHEQLDKIKSSIPKNLTLEEQAHFAFETRNKVRLDAREKMVDLKALALLPESPDFETLLKSKMERKHKTREEALQDMIDTCNKSNKDVDEYFEFEEE